MLVALTAVVFPFVLMGLPVCMELLERRVLRQVGRHRRAPVARVPAAAGGGATSRSIEPSAADTDAIGRVVGVGPRTPTPGGGPGSGAWWIGPTQLPAPAGGAGAPWPVRAGEPTGGSPRPVRAAPPTVRATTASSGR